MKFLKDWILFLFFPVVLGAVESAPEWKLFYTDGVKWENPAVFSSARIVYPPLKPAK